MVAVAALARDGRHRPAAVSAAVSASAPSFERPACPLCGGADAQPACAPLRDLLQRKPGEFGLVRCVSCSLLFLSPRPTRETIGFYYEGVYETPAAERMQTGILAGLGNRRRLAALLARRAPGRGERHLDVGCGYGDFALRLARRTGARVLAIDFGAAQIESVRRRAEAEGLPVETRQGTLLAEALPARAFHGASMLHYLEHTYDPIAELRHVREALSDGAAIVVEVPSARALGLAITGPYWAAHIAPQHLVLWSHDTLRRALETAGFRDVRIRDGWIPFLLPLSFAQWWHWNLGGASRVPAGLSHLLSLAAFLLLVVPLLAGELLAGPLLARAGRGEVLRATAIR